MKKLLLLFSFFLFVGAHCYSQTFSTISGPSSARVGSTEKYTFVILGGLSEETEYTFICTGGIFEKSGSSLLVQKYSKDTRFIDVSVKWGSSAMKNAQIMGYKSGELDKTKKSLTVELFADGNVLVKEKEKFQSTLPMGRAVFSGDIVEFSYVAPNYKYRIKSWKYDGNVFEKVKETDESIILKVRNNPGYPLNRTQVEVSTETNVYPIIVGVVGIWSKSMNYTWDFPYSGGPIIKNNDNIVCLGNKNINYFIDNLLGGDGTRYNLTWIAGTNLSLVSGQGNIGATFRPLGNARTVAKAVVKYTFRDGEEKVFNLENSKVWVGIPEFENAYDAVIVEAVPNMSYAFKFNVLGNDTGENTYTWSITGPAKISWTNNSGGIQFVTNPGKGGLVSITGSVRNKCGKCTKDQWIEAFVRSNGGGIDGGLKSQALIPLSDTEPVSIKVYSFSTGYLLYQEKNTINFNIQNTNLKPDIYILETTDSQGNVTREKVAKSNR